ncbi:MAG: SRPBCC family protein [Deltaproteobacteria bacterium]|nr:SRPBCC family protein [Deltaproteobacteria bacterium]
MLTLVATLVIATAPIIEAITDADDAPGVRAVFDVEADADVVLDLLWDVGRFRKIFPDIQALEVMGRPDVRTIDVRFVVDAVVAKPTYTLRRKLDVANRRVSWVNLSGDLKKIVGHWQVAAGGLGRCRVTYQTVVDVGIPGASSIYRSIVMGKVEQVIERVRMAAIAAMPKQGAPRQVPAPTPAPTTTP